MSTLKHNNKKIYSKLKTKKPWGGRDHEELPQPRS
jgi:hypothetical protein